MSTPAYLIRAARTRAGLTQSALAERLGMSQPAVARLERPGSNPTVETLARVLAAADHQLELDSRHQPIGLDQGQLESHLRMTPQERLRVHDASRRNLVRLARKARRVSG
jgi:transcriptional regulator with XRE-family HTH domain